MNPEEYTKLDRIDRDHWFYQGKRKIVRYWIDRYITLHPDDLYIDAGCGTGTMLLEMSKACHVLGLDDHQESTTIARPKVEPVGGHVLQTNMIDVPLKDGCAAVVTLLDVLEHIDDHKAALQEAIRLVRPGGLIIITVPAMKILWSDWDVALRHRRRYTRDELVALVDSPETKLLRCTYFNTALLPAIMAVRLWRKLRPSLNGKTRAEDRIPAAPINRLLMSLMTKPATWPWFQTPIGVSLLAVLRRTHVASDRSTLEITP